MNARKHKRNLFKRTLNHHIEQCVINRWVRLKFGGMKLKMSANGGFSVYGSRSAYSGFNSDEFTKTYAQALLDRKDVKNKFRLLMASSHFKNIVKRHNLRIIKIG